MIWLGCVNERWHLTYSASERNWYLVDRLSKGWMVLEMRPTDSNITFQGSMLSVPSMKTVPCALSIS